MKTKKAVSVGVLLAVVIVFSGCSSEKVEIDSLQEVSAMNKNKRGNNKQAYQKQNNSQAIDEAEYEIAESDFIKGEQLIGDIEISNLSEGEKAGLIQMREEEKLAHDVYVTLYEKWGQNIFNNISQSEQTHTDTIKVLLEKYNLTDPVTSDKVGMFTAPEMQKLYNDLTAKGNVSLVEALTVGAIIEDLDISDLNKLLATTDNEDIKIAYQNLNKGSRNHMRAFIRNLERNGGAYSPQYISQTEYNKIIGGEQERGSVDANGMSTGMIEEGGRHGQGSRDEQGNGGGRGQGQGGGNRR